MKKLKQIVVALAIMAGAGLFMVPAPAAHAVNVFDQCKNNATSAVCKSKNDDATSMVKIVINIILSILGIIAVIMIVIGGIRYTTSGGDSAGLKNARDTIVYAVVGLIIAIMSFAIVNFVLDAFIP